MICSLKCSRAFSLPTALATFLCHCGCVWVRSFLGSINISTLFESSRLWASADLNPYKRHQPPLTSMRSGVTYTKPQRWPAASPTRVCNCIGSCCTVLSVAYVYSIRSPGHAWLLVIKQRDVRDCRPHSGRNYRLANLMIVAHIALPIYLPHGELPIYSIVVSQCMQVRYTYCPTGSLDRRL